MEKTESIQPLNLTYGATCHEELHHNTYCSLSKTSNPFLRTSSERMQFQPRWNSGAGSWVWEIRADRRKNLARFRGIVDICTCDIQLTSDTWVVQIRTVQSKAWGSWGKQYHLHTRWLVVWAVSVHEKSSSLVPTAWSLSQFLDLSSPQKMIIGGIVCLIALAHQQLLLFALYFQTLWDEPSSDHVLQWH